MAKKKTLGEVKSAFREVWGDRYIYDHITEDNYINTRTKAPVECKEHGIFYITPHDHIQKHGCAYCARCKKRTIEDFVNMAKQKHGEKYDYSLVNYISNHVKVKIICPIHGVFEQDPCSHLAGHGCPYCADRVKLTNEEFIKRSKEKHGDLYDYTLVDYKDSHTEVKIVCKKCGNIFEQKPNVHLSGHGCNQCNRNNVYESLKLPIEEWKRRSFLSHRIEYDYSLVSFANLFEKVWIGCALHGWFQQEAKSHMDGQYCPLCNIRSKGELEIRTLLKRKEIPFVFQYPIPNNNLFCKNKNIIVDFYLPTFNTMIEYNGAQHYKPIPKWGGEETFEKQEERDYSLRQYCKEHHIRLIEISYKEFKNVETILNKKLKI